MFKRILPLLAIFVASDAFGLDVSAENINGCNQFFAPWGHQWSFQNRVYKFVEPRYKVVDGWVLKVDDPDIVNAKSSLINMLNSNSLSGVATADYIADNRSDNTWRRYEGVFGIRASSGDYIHVILNHQLDPDHAVACADYSAGIAYLLTFSKNVNVLRGDYKIITGSAASAPASGSIGSEIGLEYIGNRLRAVGVVRSIRKFTYVEKYGSEL